MERRNAVRLRVAMITLRQHERFWSDVNTEGPVSKHLGTRCWLWNGNTSKDGYGRFTITHTKYQATHVSWLLCFGKAPPKGLQLDHLCRVRSCVRPSHLEPVTQQVNASRGIAGDIAGARQRAKTHCPKGHPYSGKNLYTRPSAFGHKRECRTCIRDRNRK